MQPVGPIFDTDRQDFGAKSDQTKFANLKIDRFRAATLCDLEPWNRLTPPLTLL